MKAPFDSVEIEIIPHAKQQYSTCGNWRIVNGLGEKKVLLISVSDTGNWLSNHLVAIHEYAEAFMCLAKDITQEMVDSFDTQYEASRKEGDDSEPGDSITAPYWPQHGVATGFERIMCPIVGITWAEHEANINKLFDEKSK